MTHAPRHSSSNLTGTPGFFAPNGDQDASEDEDRSFHELQPGQDIVLDSNANLRKMIISPNSWQKSFWGMLSILAISYDIVMIPLMVFDLPSNAFFVAMSWTTACFWTFDFVLTFFTGFYINGRLDMRFSSIADRYLKSWLFPDVFLVILDWLFLVMNLDGTRDLEGAGILRIGKSGRALRALRAIRLLRIIKVGGLVMRAVDHVRSESFLMFAKVVGLLMIAIVASHVLACGWYGIAMLEPTSSNTWTIVYGIQNREVDYSYATSMQWALAQFAPATTEIAPTNTGESIYASCVLLVGLVFFSFFLAGIEDSWRHFQNTNADRVEAEALMREYFRQYKVPTAVTDRIWNFFRQNYKQRRRRVKEQDIDFLGDLPEILQMHLRKSVYMPELRKHPFFGILESKQKYTDGLMKICNEALTQEFCFPGEDLFYAGFAAEKMYIALSGVLDYFAKRIVIPIKVTTDQMVTEAVLWVRWHHKGRLTSSTSSSCVTLNASRFHGVVADSGALFKRLQAYSVRFLEMVRTELSLSDIIEDVETMLEIAEASAAEENVENK